MVKEGYMDIEITMRLAEAWDRDRHGDSHTISHKIYCM